VVLFVASKEDILKIREIVIINPDRRASIVQILIKCFNGDRLSTPRNQVLALLFRPSPVITPAIALAPAPPTLITRTTQIKPRGLLKNANIFVAAAQYCIEKARDPL
jgi:hypothetical protein